MKRPDSIKILNYHFQVRTSARKYSDVAGAYGWFDPERETIFLSKGMTPAREREVLLHEILHALNKAFQLDGKSDDESIASRLAPGLMTVFNDNPHFAKWLLQ